MNVPKGYKMTEVEVIPEDWEVKKLGELGIFLKGSGVKKNESLSGDLPCIRYGEIYTKYNYYIKEIYSYISHEVASTATKMEKNDILFAGSGETKEEIGKCVAFVHDLEAYAGGDIIILRPYKPYKIDSIFLGYYLNSAPISKQKASKGQGDAVVHISTKALSMIEVKIPSVDEQRSIARVLSDTDELINALDKLIAKKRDIKKAVMQELLTGKTRLPRFSGKWEVNTIEQCADCLDSLRVPLNETNRSKMQGHIPYCGANGVLDYIDDFIIDDDIILLAEDGGYFDDYENRPIAYRIRGKCWVNNHVHILKAKRDFDQGFLFYSLVHKNILAYLATGTRSKLNKKEMNKIEIFFPKDKAEQQAIAQVLSDMDKEITALEQRRDKTKAIKQGMMQALLTGRIRLPKGDTNDA